MLDFHDELGHPNATITVMCIGFGGDFGRGSSQFGISLIYIFSLWRCLLTGVECWATTGGKNRGKIYSWGWYSPAITFAPSPVRIFVWPTYLTEASLQKEIHIALGVLKCFVVVRSKVFSETPCRSVPLTVIKSLGAVHYFCPRLPKFIHLAKASNQSNSVFGLILNSCRSCLFASKILFVET